MQRWKQGDKEVIHKLSNKEGASHDLCQKAYFNIHVIEENRITHRFHSHCSNGVHFHIPISSSTHVYGSSHLVTMGIYVHLF